MSRSPDDIRLAIADAEVALGRARGRWCTSEAWRRLNALRAELDAATAPDTLPHRHEIEEWEDLLP